MRGRHADDIGRLFFAQQAKAPAPPKNLKLIPANVDLSDVMLGFNEALGVQCTYCHVAGDFASDANPLKETARNMITLVRRAEPFFPSTAGPFPRGYHEVDCMTCHRGKTQPETKTLAARYPGQLQAAAATVE